MDQVPLLRLGETDMQPIKRKRAFLPKVKTGCGTCKQVLRFSVRSGQHFDQDGRLRKVKCDEAKPECTGTQRYKRPGPRGSSTGGIFSDQAIRCLSTGRKCDGYQLQLSKTPAPGNSIQTQPGFFSSQAERRSFDFCQSRACQELAGHFNRPFWTQEVLRAATYYPSIRHLVIALGSAYEGFEHEASRLSDVCGLAAREQFALCQANQSIRLLNGLFYRPQRVSRWRTQAVSLPPLSWYVSCSMKGCIVHTSLILDWC